MIDINKQDEHGLNAFWIAAKHGYWDVMRVLSENDIEIYNSDALGNNALHLCARFDSHYNVFENLVNSNYDLHIVNQNGDTACHIAAQKGNLKHLQVLVDKEADINARNNHLLSPLYLAILNKHSECVEFLMEMGAEIF